MRIRLGRAQERAHLHDIWERSVRATHHFLDEAAIAALGPAVAAELASEAIAWWVVASADVPIGFMGYSPGTIEGLFIDPDHRGRGCGTLLVTHAQKLAAGTLKVDVNEDNGAAVGFYQARGFKVVGRSPTDGAGRPFPILHMMRMAG